MATAHEIELGAVDTVIKSFKEDFTSPLETVLFALMTARAAPKPKVQ